LGTPQRSREQRGKPSIKAPASRLASSSSSSHGHSTSLNFSIYENQRGRGNLNEEEEDNAGIGRCVRREKDFFMNIINHAVLPNASYPMV
jgi:hypothetical protein